ncbi:MAG: transcriptional regulator [Campylobacterota bacterium]|nr:transcriptional regulator [Campylobacterota bacterium]
MRFAMLVAIVADELEDQAINIAKENGAGGVTITKASGIGLNEKKTFFGLTYERAESVLMFMLEKKTSLKVMKALNRELDLENSGHGMVVTMPIDHIAGIPENQLEKFQDQIKTEI